jgi:hydroxypyruvate reductase
MEADIVTLLISDTNHGDEASVASGPTLAPPSSVQTAEEIVAKYQLDGKLPTTILQALHESRRASKTQFSRAPYYVLAESQTAIDAAVSRASRIVFV